MHNVIYLLLYQICKILRRNIRGLLYDTLAIEHRHTKLIEECITLKLFTEVCFFVFIQKPYQTPHISGITFIILVLAPCIYVRKIACPRERHTKNDPRKSLYVHSLHCATIIVMRKIKFGIAQFCLFRAYNGFYRQRKRQKKKKKKKETACTSDLHFDISISQSIIM